MNISSRPNNPYDNNQYKQHVIMFRVDFYTEENRPATLEEINELEEVIQNALHGKANVKLARNETADYTTHGLINQHLH